MPQLSFSQCGPRETQGHDEDTINEIFGQKTLIFKRKDMTKTLRLQTGLSDGSNSPTNIDGSNTATDWVPFYIDKAEEKEESDKNKSFSEEGGTGRTGRQI